MNLLYVDIFLMHLDMNDGRCGDIRGVGDGESPQEGVPRPAAHAGHPQEYAQEEDFSEVSSVSSKSRFSNIHK